MNIFLVGNLPIFDPVLGFPRGFWPFSLYSPIFVVAIVPVCSRRCLTRNCRSGVDRPRTHTDRRTARVTVKATKVTLNSGIVPKGMFGTSLLKFGNIIYNNFAIDILY